MHVKVRETFKLLAGFLQYNGGMLGEAEDFKCGFVVYSNQNRSALVCDLLSYNSQFVGQLKEDKSLVLRTHDLIFFTTDLQTVNYYTTRADLFLKQVVCVVKDNQKIL